MARKLSARILAYLSIVSLGGCPAAALYYGHIQTAWLFAMFLLTAGIACLLDPDL
jgi:hypothetical protein